MKVMGIIAEYNPFHNGHSYHIQKARELTGADYCIVVMSGDFTQRGEPALLDKYARAEMALRCGADLVLELPVCCACASARHFADGAVGLLDALGVVDFLVFGSECGDITLLQKAGQLLQQEPAAYQTLLQDGLKAGLSFPAAREKAITACLCPEAISGAASLEASCDVPFPSEAFDGLFSSPNNILGMEYCRSLLARDSSITPVTVTRQGSGYLDPSLSPENSSALAIRAAFMENQPPRDISVHVPEAVSAILKKAYEKTMPVFPDMFSMLLQYKLLAEADTGFTDYLDVSAELSNRIVNLLPRYRDFSSFCQMLKTKELTYTRISRALLHILLDIRSTHMELCRALTFAPYARILGFRRSAAPLLGAVKNNGCVPLISKLADAHRFLTPAAMALLEKDIQAAHIYNMVLLHTYGTALPHEMQRQLVITE